MDILQCYSDPTETEGVVETEPKEVEDVSQHEPEANTEEEETEKAIAEIKVGDDGDSGEAVDGAEEEDPKDEKTEVKEEKPAAEPISPKKEDAGVDKGRMMKPSEMKKNFEAKSQEAQKERQASSSPRGSYSARNSRSDLPKAANASPARKSTSEKKDTSPKSQKPAGEDSVDKISIVKPSQISKKNIQVEWMVDSEKKKAEGSARWANSPRSKEVGDGGGTSKKLKNIDQLHPIGKIFGLQSTRDPSGKKPKIILPPRGAYC